MFDRFYPQVLLPHGTLNARDTAQAVKLAYQLIYKLQDGVVGDVAHLGIGTHIDRLNVTPIANGLYIETDRSALYYATTYLEAISWVYLSGTMTAVLASRPADLGVTDTNFRFTATDTAQHFKWTGSAWRQEAEIDDAATNTIVTPLELIHRSSGVPAALFGTALSLQADNAAHTLKSLGTLGMAWTTATAASEASDFIVKTMAGGTLTETLRVDSTGALSLTIGTKIGKFTHANSATRTWTLPNADGNIVYQTAALTASNLVVGGGTALAKALGSLGTTVQVLHGNAAGDPTWSAVSLTADVSGILPSANGGNGVSNATQTYTPTLFNTTNMAASTAYQCQYFRVGSVVTVSGRVDVDPTAAAATVLGISLPIASNIGATEDLGGVAFAPNIAGQGAGIYGDAANDRAAMQWVAVDITNQAMLFTFTYRII